MIPKFVSLLERGKPCFIHGNGQKKKRYLYIDDVVRAFDLILHQAAPGEVYNIGTSFEISPLETAKKLIQLFGLEGRENQYIQFVPDRNFAECRYAIDATKLHKLGWKPDVSFEDGLQRTIAWYKKNFNNWENAETSLVPHPKVQWTDYGGDIWNVSN